MCSFPIRIHIFTLFNLIEDAWRRAPAAKEAGQAKLQVEYAETPLSLDAERLSAAIELAEKEGVSIMYTYQAKEKLKKLHEQSAKEKELHKALENAEAKPCAETRKKLARAWSVAAVAWCSHRRSCHARPKA